jgi:hypothetical protein
MVSLQLSPSPAKAITNGAVRVIAFRENRYLDVLCPVYAALIIKIDDLAFLT